MEHVKENEPFLKALSKAHSKQAKGLIKTAKTKQLDALCEIILNVLKEVIAIPKGIVKKLKKYKKVIRSLAEKKLAKYIRRKVILKYLNIIQTVVGAALPVISVGLGIASF
jgi:hypothetical protein